MIPVGHGGPGAWVLPRVTHCLCTRQETEYPQPIRLLNEMPTLSWRRHLQSSNSAIEAPTELGDLNRGAVSRDRLDVLREADAIVREETAAAGVDRDIWQLPVVLLADVRSVGVQGDGRTYGHPIVLRPVSSEDAMTADWSRLPYDLLARISTRITNEVREVNRVVLDITSKPPGTIEWE